MINLRYHVVSITAIFLALGLGLMMGSTFLDRATVESLNGQLDSLQGELSRNDEEIGALRDELDDVRSDADLLAEQGTAPLLAGELTDVGVVVLVVRGTESGMVDRSLAALSASGASVDGTWTITERFSLDDEPERRDLAATLGISSDSEDRLRRETTQALASVLLDRMATVTPVDGTSSDDDGPASDDGTDSEDDVAGDPVDPDAPPSGDDPADTSGGADGGEPADGPAVVETTPALLTGLINAGFLEFQPLGDTDSVPTLPSENARVALISDAGSDLALDEFALPLLRALTADGPSPVVFASGLRDDEPREARGALVDVIREDPTLATRLSTVDDLESFEGWAALVLALEVAPTGQLSHYGKADSASRLLPAPDGAT